MADPSSLILAGAIGELALVGSTRSGNVLAGGVSTAMNDFYM